MKGLTTPLLRWLRGFICLCRCEGLVRGLLLDWYLGSQKLREILTLLCCITLSSSRENQRSAEEVARRISGAVAEESMQKSQYTKYPSQSLSLALHYLPFASRFPLPRPIPPCRFIRPLSLSSLSVCHFFPLALVCSCVSLLACRYVWNWGSYRQYGR